jgi:proliferating cell nuclear antigen
MNVALICFTVAIECNKEGVSFKCSGDIGSGSVSLRPHTNVEDEAQNVEINLSEPVGLTFSLKYLVNFCKASGLSSQVKLCLSNEVPLLVEYSLANNSYLRFYLAPKVHMHPHCSNESQALTINHRSATKSRA